MIERICTLSYYHHQIGSMNYYPLFKVGSWNNGMRCISLHAYMSVSACPLYHIQSQIYTNINIQFMVLLSFNSHGPRPYWDILLIVLVLSIDKRNFIQTVDCRTNCKARWSLLMSQCWRRRNVRAYTGRIQQNDWHVADEIFHFAAIFSLGTKTVRQICCRTGAFCFSSHDCLNQSNLGTDFFLLYLYSDVR